MSKIKNITKEVKKASIWAGIITALLTIFQATTGIVVPTKIIEAVKVVQTLPTVLEETTKVIEDAEKQVEELDKE
jgi:hypothetical protein